MFGRPVSAVVPALAGAALGGAFGVAAILRRGRPLHPKGVVFDAVIRRSGSRYAWGAEWLDAPGTDYGIARLSRSVGLPERLPDICGLAITFSGADGKRRDLLLATTGLAPGTRLLLVPRRDPRTSSYGSLFPYATSRGPVLLAAIPAAAAPEPAGVLRFRLLAAGLTGRWREFGALEMSERSGAPADEPVRFDPVRNPLPGLRWPEPLALLREPAYAAAQRVPVATSGPVAALGFRPPHPG